MFILFSCKPDVIKKYLQIHIKNATEVKTDKDWRGIRFTNISNDFTPEDIKTVLSHNLVATAYYHSRVTDDSPAYLDIWCNNYLAPDYKVAKAIPKTLITGQLQANPIPSS
eukprot:15351315-Ditylum_brightwellii.AAC.1